MNIYDFTCDRCGQEQLYRPDFDIGRCSAVNIHDCRMGMVTVTPIKLCNGCRNELRSFLKNEPIGCRVQVTVDTPSWLQFIKIKIFGG